MKKPDHFSQQAEAYARYRPIYPDELFRYLASLTVDKELAWDCGTGSGQAARGLAVYFNRVIATDASSAQIKKAVPESGIEYGIASAESSGIESGVADLVLVAQALHWFDIDAFYREANRVLKTGGILAVVSYRLPRINPDIDALIDRFHGDILGEYWPAERRHVDTAYKDIPFPLNKFTTPSLQIEHEWTLSRFLGYLQSWSAVARFRENQEKDPLDIIGSELSALWPTEFTKHVCWPLTTRAGRFE